MELDSVELPDYDEETAILSLLNRWLNNTIVFENEHMTPEGLGERSTPKLTIPQLGGKHTSLDSEHAKRLTVDWLNGKASFVMNPATKKPYCYYDYTAHDISGQQILQTERTRQMQRNRTSAVPVPAVTAPTICTS